MEDKLKAVFTSVFGLPAGAINRETSVDNVPEWDSLKQMNLIVAIESKFDVEFEDEEFVRMNSFGSILDILQAK